MSVTIRSLIGENPFQWCVAVFYLFKMNIRETPSKLLLCDRMWKNCMCRNSSTHPRRQNKANGESFVAATQRQSTHFTASSMGPSSPSRTCNQKWTLHTKFCIRCPLYSASSFTELMGKTRLLSSKS